MKKIFYFLILALFGSVMFHSCTEEDPISFDKTLLYGKWQSGTLFYTYSSNGNGKTWDEGDDVSEDEAQPFTWTLESADLLHIYTGEMGQSVPKSYTVTELTVTTLRYKDAYGKQFSFTKK